MSGPTSVNGPLSPPPRTERPLGDSAGDERPRLEDFAAILAQAEHPRTPEDFLGVPRCSLPADGKGLSAAEQFNAHGLLAAAKAILSRAQASGNARPAQASAEPTSLVAEQGDALQKSPQPPAFSPNHQADASSTSPPRRPGLPSTAVIQPTDVSGPNPAPIARLDGRASMARLSPEVTASRSVERANPQSASRAGSEMPALVKARTEGLEVDLVVHLPDLPTTERRSLQERLVKLLSEFGLGLRSMVVSGRLTARSGRK